MATDHVNPVFPEVGVEDEQHIGGSFRSWNCMPSLQTLFGHKVVCKGRSFCRGGSLG